MELPSDRYFAFNNNLKQNSRQLPIWLQFRSTDVNFLLGLELVTIHFFLMGVASLLLEKECCFRDGHACGDHPQIPLGFGK